MSEAARRELMVRVRGERCARAPWLVGAGGAGFGNDVMAAGRLFGSIAGTMIDLCGVHKGCLPARLRSTCVVCLCRTLRGR